jgi:nucleoside-triphosphatase THEP1
MPRRIWTVAEPKGAGKTSAILEWARRRGDVAGVAQPTIGGVRRLEIVETGERFRLEAGADEPDALVVGRYRFRREAFRRANERAIVALGRDPAVFFLDEIGALELKGEGVAPALERALATNGDRRLILVFREHLVEDIRERFGIHDDERVRLARFQSDKP